MLAAVCLAACGGDDESASFREDFPPVSQRIVSLGEEVGDQIETAAEASDEELANEFERFARELGELRGQLEELEPPEDLSDERDDLAAAMGDVRGSLQEIADAAEEGDPEAARQATIELIERSEELREARQTLAKAVRDGE
jgi:chromosome segregation ATPase